MGSKLTDLADLTPSADFALNSFLIGISDELEESDLEKLKFLCKGKYGIGKARLEKVKSALDLFDILREKLLLNENNIITLQSMLWILPRRDLQKRYVEFAESLGSSIHFVAPRETPENGYKHLKFHIRGRDLNTYGRSELDRLRSMISGLLLVPQEFVIITGIEPSNSLMITVMVPEEFAVNLFSSPPERLVMLNDVSVSHIEMGDSFIFVQENGETKSPTFINDKMDEETRNLMLRQNQMEKELENAHNKVATLTETIASMKRGDGSQWISYFLIVLIQQYHDIYENVMKVRKLIEESALDPVDSLQKLCVFKHFRYQLEKVRQCGYDENLIYSLLDAQALVFRWQKHENLDIQIADLQNANKDLERKLCLVSWEREKLAYYHSIGVKDRVMSARDEFFLRAILQNIPLKIEQRTNVEIPEECVEYVFRRFDEDISKDDLKILLEKFNISGKSRRYAALSGYRYLKTAFDAQRAHGINVELRTFVQHFLSGPLQKNELLEKLEGYVRDFFVNAQAQAQTNAGGSRKTERRKPQTYVIRKGNKKPAMARSQSRVGNDSPGEKQNYQEMKEMLSDIQNMLKKQQSSQPMAMNKNAALDEYRALFDSSKMLPTFTDKSHDPYRRFHVE